MTDQPLALEDGAFRAAQRELMGVHDELERERRALGRAMTSLFAGGWTGVAAQEFSEGWSDWETGCGLLLDGLVGMDAAMTSAVQATHHQDGAQAAALAWLQHRLGGEDA